MIILESLVFPRGAVLMADSIVAPPARSLFQTRAPACSLVFGITHSQTCLLVGPRLRALREAGFQVTLISSPGPLLERTAARAGVDCVSIPMERGVAPLADLIAMVRIGRLLARIRPQAVEFGTPKAGLLGLLAAALLGVPCRVYLLRGLRLETARGWMRRLLIATERIACACAHAVLCNSSSLRDQAIALHLTSPDRLVLLGEGSSMGVDVERFSPGASDLRARLGWSQSAPVVGFAGRLTRDKGIPELIDAFEEILRAEPAARLLLMGWFDASEDALEPALRARIEAHPCIHRTGFVEDTAPYYRAMDVMVLPTWREGFPNAVLEAQASGVPVVTTLATGARDSVVPEVTGLLVPPGNPQAIAEAVLKLLRDPERRARMGRGARRWVQQHYIESRVLALTMDFYRELLDRRMPVVVEEGSRAESALSS